MKPRVYLETTIPSYLTARPSQNVILLANQMATRDWWDQRVKLELYTSRLVLSECQAGDPEAASQRLAALEGIPLLPETVASADLADAIVRATALPTRALADAMHIAIAACHGIEFLLTWNCTHIANLALRSRIEEVCRAAGFEPPVIGTPTQLFVGDDDG